MVTGLEVERRGGVGLAALCDVTVASATASFWFPEVEKGPAPAVVLAWPPRLVGHERALRLTATGRKVGAGAAAEVTALTEHSPRVHAEIKEYLHATAGLGVAQANDLAVEKLIIGSMRPGE